jgi:hypothetical protein
MPLASIDHDAVALAPFGPLRRAEVMLVQACTTGEIAKVGLRRPEAASRERSIRARLLAFILRGGIQLPGRRIELMGAWIEGRLDLGGLDFNGSVWFYRCNFDLPVVLDTARFSGSVTFSGCHMLSLLADDLRVGKDLTLNAGCSVESDLHLRRARVGGDLNLARMDLSNGRESAPARRALVADGARIGGDVKLTDDFQAIGEVRFHGARVGGDVLASGHFNGNQLAEGGRGTALLLDRAEIHGSVLFDPKFGAAGCVSLRRARIGGDLDATGASFDWLNDAAWSDGVSLALDRARVEGALILRELQSPLQSASLRGARVGTLCDDVQSWGERITLDGFTYESLGEGALANARYRIGWLERQVPSHLRAPFRMQPWLEAARVLRKMGHEHGASLIAVRRERWLRRIGVVGAAVPAWMRWPVRAGHWVLGALCGHGQRPGRLVTWLAAVWLLCGGAYGAAVAMGDTATAQGKFSPLGYSADRLLPLLDLGLQPPVAWGEPNAWTAALRWVSYAEAGFGWVALLLLVASLAGWLDRERKI